ncbi:MAG: type IV pilus assembly protein PilM [Desulfobulbus sp.]|jgi:type IV pilus assembly protein PilM
MAKKEQLVTGIDIGSYAVKICQLQKNGDSYKLLALGSARIPHGAVEDGILQDSAAVSATLSALLKNLKIKNAKVGMSISGYSVIVKKIQLEEMDDITLEKYIEQEAEQYIPFDMDEVYLDFQRIESEKVREGRSEIMLVAAKKEVVNDYLEMLNALKLKTVLVDVDGFALENIWETTCGPLDNVALIDIGASKMNINIISHGVSVLARDVVVGSEQLTGQIAQLLNIDFEDAEKVKLGIMPAPDRQDDMERIFDKICTQWVLEIKKAIDLYLANNPEKRLHSIVLSGGGAKVHGFGDYLQQETGLPVSLFNPFEKIIFEEKKFDEKYLEAIGMEMAIATGIAIRHPDF